MPGSPGGLLPGDWHPNSVHAWRWRMNKHTLTARGPHHHHHPDQHSTAQYNHKNTHIRTTTHNTQHTIKHMTHTHHGVLFQTSRESGERGDRKKEREEVEKRRESQGERGERVVNRKRDTRGQDERGERVVNRKRETRGQDGRGERAVKRRREMRRLREQHKRRSGK